MIGTDRRVTTAVVALVLAMAAGPAGAQNTGDGKACTFYPKNGSDPVPVANGETYSTRAHGGKGGGGSGMPVKWLCRNGKLVKVE